MAEIGQEADCLLLCVVQLYDVFTINTILFLEDPGFCDKEEGGPFVADGGIAHPGMYGLFAIIAAANQIAGCNVALADTNGGTLSSKATVILGTSGTV